MSTHTFETPLEASRPVGVAQELTGSKLNANTVYARKVVLTGEIRTLSTENGQWCLLNCIRLLSRVVGNLDIALPKGLDDFEQAVSRLAQGVWSQNRVTLRRLEEAVLDDAWAVLNIGNQGRTDLAWTSINSNGWVARCTSGASPLPEDCEQANPIGAMLAASVGVAEVFKRVYGVPATSRPMIDIEEFSLFTMSKEFANCGPALPAQLTLPNAAMVGGGAIGNALTLLISQLPLRGELHIIDKQVFAKENLGTCCLLDNPNWLGESKARALADWLSSNASADLIVTGELATVATSTENNNLSGRGIDLVLNGLDDNSARRDAQRLWPSLIVDGAINAMGAAVVTHSLSHPEWACLSCTFPQPKQDGLALQARATGLSRTSLKGNTNRPITDADIDAAEPEVRDRLREEMRRGSTLCAALPTLLAVQRLGVKLDEGFRPSVPFVATAAAALVMAQVYRSLCWPSDRFFHEYQIADLFRGFGTGHPVFRHASTTCNCVTYRHAILALAQKRRALGETRTSN